MFRNIRNAFQNAANTMSEETRGPSTQQQQQQQQQQQSPQAPPQRAPPASMKAIKKLPTIRVTPEDLIDANNRECCICLEENNIDDLVTRLPCAHIFHTHCIIGWLSNHSCTCPVCRYELPTDYPQYEQGRIERMKLRKPRFAMHELKRMTVSELLELRRQPLTGLFEKKDVIQSLIDNDWIDIIPSPEPVQYELEVLQNMKIGELKRTMAEAGVFFRKEDVLMKSDMITVFENSGRLVLIRSNTEETKDLLGNYETMAKPKPHRRQILVETVNENSVGRSELVETNSEMDEVVEMFPRRNQHFTPNGIPMVPNTESVSSVQNEPGYGSDEPDTHNSMPSERVAQHHTVTENDSLDEELSGLNGNRNDSVAGSASQSDTGGPTQMDVDEVDLSTIINLTESGIDHRSTFDHYTVNHLRTLGKDLQIDLSHCLERKDMVETFVNMGITGNEDPLVLSPLMFSTWSVSQLRLVASEMKVNISECTNKGEMVKSILHAGNIERPYLRDYLRSLSPLTTKSLADLRAIARELQVNIRDCLEKDEIIHRLIVRDRRVGVN